jgi:hypothetical protein
MKISTRTALVLSVLLAILFVGCSPTPKQETAQPPDLSKAVVNAGFGVPGAGNVLPLGLMDTFRYLMQVQQSFPGTFIMQGPAGQFLLSWPMQDGTYGFLGLASNGAPLDVLKLTGNYSSTYTFADLVKYLEQNGWTYVGPAALPAWVTNTLGTVSAFSIAYGNMLASPIPMIIILPGGGYVDPTYSGKN